MSPAPADTGRVGPRGIGRGSFGTAPDGRAVESYELRNGAGMALRFVSYGGIILTLTAPDRDGRLADVTLGYATLEPYFRNSPFFGAIIGRHANRLARGRFTLDGRTYQLPINNPPNHLHGGDGGFHKVIWTVEPFESTPGVGAVLTHRSPSGEEGYPGNLDVRVTYTLGDDNTLAFDFHAVTDEPTPVNLTQHAYYNLAGHAAGSILDHELELAAPAFTPIDETSIPTGEIRPVEGTPFDFRTPRRIGDRIDAPDEQLRHAGGYDHNFVIRGEAGALRLAARLRDRATGRVLEVLTTEPGLQFYAGNSLTGGPPGKHGRPYGPRDGLALESQHFPDAPNQLAFPSTILRPGHAFRSRTVYRFTTDAER